MAEYTVRLPSLGEDAADHARVSFVYKDAGETVAKDDDLIEMVTDKATFNVPAPCPGKILEMLVHEDDDVKVGQPICTMDVADADRPAE